MSTQALSTVNLDLENPSGGFGYKLLEPQDFCERSWRWMFGPLISYNRCEIITEVALRIITFFPIVALSAVSLVLGCVGRVVIFFTPWTPTWKLFSAITSGGTAEDVRQALKAGANPHACDWRNQSLLHHAALHNRADLIPILVDAGININSKDNKGHTPLLTAVKNEKDCHEVIEALLSIPTLDLNLPDKDGNSVLYHALINDNTPFAKKLIQKGANYESINAAGESALVWCKDPVLLEHLIKLGLDPNQKTQLKLQPLIFLHVKIYEKACDKAAESNFLNPEDNKKCQQALEMIRLMLANGANPNIWGKFEQGDLIGPLIVKVTRLRLYPVLQLLLNHKDINIEACSTSGRTAMIQAATWADPVGFTMLLRAGAYFNPQQYDKLRLQTLHMECLEELGASNIGVNIRKALEQPKTPNPYLDIFEFPKSNFVINRTAMLQRHKMNQWQMFTKSRRCVEENIATQQEARKRLYTVIQNMKTGLLPELVDMVVDYVHLSNKQRYERPAFDVTPDGHFTTA